MLYLIAIYIGFEEVLSLKANIYDSLSLTKHIANKIYVVYMEKCVSQQKYLKQIFANPFTYGAYVFTSIKLKKNIKMQTINYIFN